MTTNIGKADEAGSRWGRIPAWWLDHPDLDADGLAVLAALATYADENGLCWPSQSTLAAKLKRSRPTVNRILRRLDEIGLVTVGHRRGRDGARLSCLYRLRFEPETTEPAHGVGARDRDDSASDAPCPAASQEQLQSEQNPDSPASGGRATAHAVPDGWMPGADDLRWARDRFGDVDLARHAEGFVLRCRAHGYRYRDVGAAWRAWLAQDAGAGRVPAIRTPAIRTPMTRHAHPSAASAAEQRVGAWMAVAERLRTERPAAAPGATPRATPWS